MREQDDALRQRSRNRQRCLCLLRWLTGAAVPLLATSLLLLIRSHDTVFTDVVLSYLLAVVTVVVWADLGPGLVASGVAALCLDEYFADYLYGNSRLLRGWLIVDDVRSAGFLCGATVLCVLISWTVRQRVRVIVTQACRENTPGVSPDELAVAIGKPVAAFVTVAQTHDGELWAVDRADQDPRYSPALLRFGSELTDRQGPL